MNFAENLAAFKVPRFMNFEKNYQKQQLEKFYEEPLLKKKRRNSEDEHKELMI